MTRDTERSAMSRRPTIQEQRSHIEAALRDFSRNRYLDGLEAGLLIADKVLGWVETGTYVQTGEAIDRQTLAGWIKEEIERARTLYDGR